ARRRLHRRPPLARPRRERRPRRGQRGEGVPVVRLDGAGRSGQATGGVERSAGGRTPVMKFTVTIDRDEDGVWVVECPSIPGCVSQGQTREEALKNIQEAIALCLEVRAERGLPLTIETRQGEVAA